MNRRFLCVLAVLGLPGLALGQTGYAITGGLSNFDCGNHCDTPCNEFEIEIEGIEPGDVVHCYANSNYGAPTVTPSALGTIIDYRFPNHPTAVNAIEHFGISLRTLNSYNAIRVRWMVSGVPATVNGQVPVAGGGSAPATQPMLPSISADKFIGGEGDTIISVSVTNNDPFQSIWVERSAVITNGVVALESLMTNNSLVTTSLQIDGAPFPLAAGSTVSLDSDLIELEGDQSIVVSAKYFQNLAVGGPFGQTEVLGPELGNVMTATIASPEGACVENAPLILVEPQNVTANGGATVLLRVEVQGDEIPSTIQWMKEGVPLSNGGMFHGVTGDELEIDELNSATEGFYCVSVSNACGYSLSRSALVFITGHNDAPFRPTPAPCSVDVTGVGGPPELPDNQLTVDDVIAFVNEFSDGNGCPGGAPCSLADLTGVGGEPAPADGELTVDDVIFFFNGFSNGCP